MNGPRGRVDGTIKEHFSNRAGGKAFPPARFFCCSWGYDNARSMRAMMFIHFFPTNGCKPHK